MKRILLTILFVTVYMCSHAQPGIVKANGLKIAYESFGKLTDPAIILIQGTGTPMTGWPVEFCQKLAASNLRVIRFDNRDIGLSTKLDSLGQPDWGAIYPFVKTCKPAPLQYSILDMAKDVIGLMDALKIKRANIAGVSMGGAIAQLVTVNFPDRVLTLTSAAASSGNPNLPAGSETALKVMSTPPPVTTNADTLASYLIGVYKALGSTDDDNTLRARAMLHITRCWNPLAVNRQVAAIWVGDNCDRRELLAKIKVPVMVIHGDGDPIVPIEAGREVAAAIPGAEFIVIKGMGHDLSMEFVDQLVKAIMRNVKKKKV
jgi:pimeloyl-ACP methyl ester carboxylesterase